MKTYFSAGDAGTIHKPENTSVKRHVQKRYFSSKPGKKAVPYAFVAAKRKELRMNTNQASV